MPKTPTTAKQPSPKSPAPKPPPLTRQDVKTAETAQAVIERIVGTDGKVKKGKLHELPAVSAVYAETAEMNRAISLLSEGHRLKTEIKKMEEGYYLDGDEQVPGLKDIKDDLIAICMGADVPGFRFAGKAVLVLTQTRKSLKQEKLIEALLGAGVAPAVIGEAIKDATVDGDPFYVVKLEELS